ncbi:MAG: polysaccharide deacetylase family protein [Treponema sp.]|jgi:peptidoglycan/xylan/chitin deacetylase (PgdA/CDA1 family)|nr:polysaccharide deacetylase family protein [Treponema sp.]
MIVGKADKADKCIALTFDDGPDSTTGKLLAILRELQVCATFFLCGERIRVFPNEAKAIADAGHEIGNHSYDHVYMNELEEEAIYRNFKQAEGAIVEVAGKKPPFIRVPYVSYSESVFKAAMNMNMPVVGCDVIGHDWEEAVDEANIVENVLSSAKDGGVILLHEPYEKTRAALPVIVNALRLRGYAIMSVGELAKQRHMTLQAGVCYNALQEM